MDDTISREAAIEAIRASAQKYTGFMEMEMYTDDDAVKAIEALPTAEKVGEWIEVENKWGGLEIRCSECGAQVPRDGWGNAMQCNYCPNCGARMKGSDDEYEETVRV